MEIFTLTIRFPYDDSEEPWSRTIEVSENYTLQQLHTYIQKIIEFDDEHLYEFYASRKPRNKKYSIPSTTKLNEVYPLNRLKLYYLFDFGDCWLFELKKSRKKKLASKTSVLPTVIEAVGENPEQYPGWEDEYR